MTAILFENFWTLLIIGVVFSGLAWYLAVERRTKFWLLAAKILPLVFAILLAINYFVVTDREEIQTQVVKLITACQAGNVDTLKPLIDNDFSATGLTKNEILAELKHIFARLTLANVQLLDVANNPPVVRLVCLTQITTKSGDDLARIHSEWELTFRKRDKTWLLDTVRPVRLMTRPVNDIREILRESHQVP
ncbi:MAG: hypothetical protein WC975_16060 [Phycisphaerae bacterium]